MELTEDRGGDHLIGSFLRRKRFGKLSVGVLQRYSVGSRKNSTRIYMNNSKNS